MSGIKKINWGFLKKSHSPAPPATGTTAVNGVDIPIGIFPIQFPSYQNAYNWIASVDYNISARDQLRGRYLGNSASGIDPEVSPTLPAFAQNRTPTSKLVSLAEFHNFSPNLL